MKFGVVNLADSKGGILAHSLTLASGKRLRKGVVIDDKILSKLVEAGIQQITIAMPDDDDVLEDLAATKIAKKLFSRNIQIDKASTGRVNLFAKTNGLFCVSSDTINSINAIDPAITIATLPDYSSVNEGRLIATIKIIPYAVKDVSVEAVLSLDLQNAIKLSDYQAKRIGLISTVLPTLKPKIMDKTRKVLEQRLLPSASQLVKEVRTDHDGDSIASAIENLKSSCDMIIIFGASAISDIADCIPEGIQKAGGEVIRFGMPVDPGNLILLAKLKKIPIIGAPGCARSIAENGFDWILQRLLAGLDVTADDVAKMGVGGLLMETGSRPHPRELITASSHKTAGVILAAGQSRRMGDANKMTVAVNGKPMLRHVVEAANGSNLQGINIITGHEPDAVIKIIAGVQCDIFHNPVYQEGLSTSLALGISKLQDDVSHALVMLGDMPFISVQMIDKMVKRSIQAPEAIIVATHEGKRGNPVLWPRKFFVELQTVEGDVGARHIVEANKESVVEVELGKAASIDLDTPQAVHIAENEG